MDLEKEQKTVKENKMGVQPVNKLLIGMSFPMMISMLVQAMYNIVDSIFVSHVSEDALAALTLAFPVQILVIAVGTGTGIGVNAVLSKALGEKNLEKVNKAATNGIFLAVLSGIVFIAVGLLAVKPFFATQNTENQVILNYGIQYLTICCVCSIGVFMQMMFERLLQSTGRTMYSMITQATGAIINIILDPILIFGLFGLPRMEVAGAALATIFGQLVAAAMAVVFNIKKNPEVNISFKGFKPDIRMIGTIYSVGIPSIIMQAIGSVMNYLMNQILLGFSDTAAAVFGAYFKLQSFFFMPVFGLNGGLVPIIAFNFGAGKRSRMIKAVKLGVIYAEIIFIIGVLVFEFLPEPLLLIFKASPEMLAMGTKALRIIAIHFPVAAYCIIVGTLFQALGHGMCSMWVSITRQLLVLIPAAYLLSKLGNVDYVWFAFPIAEVASFIISTIFLIYVYNKTVKKVADNV